MNYWPCSGVEFAESSVGFVVELLGLVGVVFVVSGCEDGGVELLLSWDGDAGACGA